MPKTKSTKTSVRLVKRGDIVKTNEGAEEVVREVEVILRLSNGNTEVHDPKDVVEVLPPEELPELTEEV